MPPRRCTIPTHPSRCWVVKSYPTECPSCGAAVLYRRCTTESRVFLDIPQSPSDGFQRHACGEGSVVRYGMYAKTLRELGVAYPKPRSVWSRRRSSKRAAGNRGLPLDRGVLDRRIVELRALFSDVPPDSRVWQQVRAVLIHMGRLEASAVSEDDTSQRVEKLWARVWKRLHSAIQ